jgi:hypothetical protein
MTGKSKRTQIFWNTADVGQPESITLIVKKDKITKKDWIIKRTAEQQKSSSGSRAIYPTG